MIGANGQVIENNTVLELDNRLGKSTNKAWENEGVTQNVYENNVVNSLTWIKFTLTPEC